jgi:hypothetical protein
VSEAIAAKLDEARALIEKGWCQKDYARDAGGAGEWPTDAACACYCSAGAIMAIANENLELEDALEDAFRKATGGSIITWNDHPNRTQAEVIEAFRKAAELARSGVTA